MGIKIKGTAKGSNLVDMVDRAIEKAEWTPMTIEEHNDLNSRMDWRDRKVLCQICIITDKIAEATHICEACGFEICDNEANHVLDHGRIDDPYNEAN